MKAACEAADSSKYYSDTAEAIVKASGFTLPQASIMLCIDQYGQKYELPPFMINEPISYGESKANEMTPQGKSKVITVTVRSSKRTDVNLIISTHDTGKTLKTAYVSHTKATETLRLFFNGVEIKDEGYLAKLEDGVVVQALG